MRVLQRFAILAFLSHVAAFTPALIPSAWGPTSCSPLRSASTSLHRDVDDNRAGSLVGLRGGHGALKPQRGRRGAGLLLSLSVVALGLLFAIGFPGRASAAAAAVAPKLELQQRLISILPAGFVEAFSLIVLSELGDKTFFVAGLFAMKTNRAIAFTGAILALAVMTSVAVFLGQLVQRAPDLGGLSGVPIADYITIGTFFFFGCKLLSEAYNMKSGDKSAIEEELDDANKDLSAVEAKLSGTARKIIQAFLLVFAAEVGDRSFIATIALAAAYDPISVGLGAIGGHAVATGIAVVSGVYLAKYLSPRIISYISGALFLVFSATTALGVF